MTVVRSVLTAAQLTAQFSASGYSRPTAVKDIRERPGRQRRFAEDVCTWDATAARLTGLAAGNYTFRVVGTNADGTGVAATTKTLQRYVARLTHMSVMLSAALPISD